jgi:hypothetical protein
MQDGYHNLTRKLGMLMEWSTFDCPFTFDVMLRMDIDVFPNPLRIQEYARTLPPMTISGFVWSQTPVIREADHRWQDLEYPVESYFPYSGGGSCLITNDLVSYIGREHRQGLLRYYANEDATMGIWIAGRRVKLIHNKNVLARECTAEMLTSKDNISKGAHVVMSANLLQCENPCRCDD